MFKDLVEPWGQYIAKVGQAWAPDDPRRDLNVEVVNRLFQLDIILDYLNKALRIFSGDQDEERRKQAEEELFLFTDAFYFFAWRLVEILKRALFSQFRAL